jgi:hypothetical protein
MSETRQTPWLLKTYSAQLEQSASNIVAKIETISSSIGESANWNSTYSEVSNGSAKWNDVFDTVGEASGKWNSVYGSVEDTSGKLNDGFNSLSLNSANWNSTYSDFSKNSGSYGSTYTDVSENSANWNSVYNDFANNSSSFILTYSAVSANSARWVESGVSSVLTDGTTVSGNGTEESKIGLVGPHYNLVAGDNMTIVPSGNDLIFSSTGGSASGNYLPLSGGVVSGTTTISGNSFDTQLILARLQGNGEIQSAYCGVDVYGGAFIKAAQEQEPELHVNADGVYYKTINSSEMTVPLYNKGEVSGYEAFGFDNSGKPKAVQLAGKYIQFVDPTTQESELKIQYIRAVQDAANIPETSNYPTLWVVVSAVG